MLFCLALVCVVLLSLVRCFAPLWGAVWCWPPPRPPAAVPRFFFACRVCAGCASTPPPRLVVVPCVVRCRVVLRSVVCYVICPLLCGVLVSGRVLVPCCPARCCAGSCCAVFVVLCCCPLLRSLLVFFLRSSVPFRGAPGCFSLCGALPWCVLLFGVALSRCAPVLVSAALCRFVLCCAVMHLLVLCCVVCFVAVLGSRLASSAAVTRCCALSILGRGAVSSCCAACGPGAVVPCAVFLGPFRFAAPLVRCCAGVPASLLSVRCSLAPVALAGALCCCLLCWGVCCWARLSSAVSWWVLVAPGLVFQWCAVVCPWVLCCAVWLCVVPPGVVLLCAAFFCFAVFGAVARCVVPCGAGRRHGVLCLPALCFVFSPRAVCLLPCCVAACCCSPLCFVPSA